VPDQLRRGGATRQAYSEVVAQAKQPIVPSFADIEEREMQEISVLFLQQRPNQRRLDGDFGRRRCTDRHMEPIAPGGKPFDRYEGAEPNVANSRRSAIR
jgi:hypothetical protein